MLRIRILVNGEVPKFVARLLLFFVTIVSEEELTNINQSLLSDYQCFLITLSQINLGKNSRNLYE